jgi:hypothetical protein
MEKSKKNAYAVALGRKGGRKGGPARAANMTPDQRKASARNAVLARWAKIKLTSAPADNERELLCFGRGALHKQEQENPMPGRKIRIPFPTPASPLRDGYEVGVRESTERWSEITLEDGSVLRLKPTVFSAVRIEGEFDPEDNPMYAVKAGQVLVIASAPDNLRKPKSGKVH